MKTIIVTGLAGNLGQAIAKKFLSEGYRICGTIRQNDSIPALPVNSNLEANTVDLDNEKAANDFANSVIGKHGAIDAAILTVGGFAMGNLANTTGKDIEEQISLNFKTVWNIAQPVFNHMFQNGRGRIFFIGSRAGSDMQQSRSTVAYGLSKSLIFRLAELMNAEAKGTNVVTNVIVPSIIDTAQNRKSMPDADFSKWVTPDAIADLVYFYCSPEADGLREPVIKIYNNS